MEQGTQKDSSFMSVSIVMCVGKICEKNRFKLGRKVSIINNFAHWPGVLNDSQ